MVFTPESGVTKDQMQTLCQATKQLDGAVRKFVAAFEPKFGKVVPSESTGIDDQATAIDQLIHQVNADAVLVDALAFAFRQEVLSKIGDWARDKKPE